jgi:lipopolysaccharide export system protein LptA
MPKRLVPVLLGLVVGLTVFAQDTVTQNTVTQSTAAQPPARPGAQPQDTQPRNAQPQAEAAEDERIITISYDGGTRNSPDLRYGPYVYEHPEPDGIRANVSNLEIFAQRGELRAPDEVLIAEAEGEREANFTGGVRVERGRLTATGPALNYSEATGRGVMPERTAIVVKPADAEDDMVNIETDEVTFDVDTDTSVSRGNVTLTNGAQDAEAQELIFEEERDLAVLSDENSQAVARRENDDGTFLTITADEIRVLTGTDVLLATGNVSIVDGDITTTGDTVYYDDAASRAEVIGNPAVSVDEAFGSTIRGGRIEQRTDIDSVQQLSDPTPSFNAAQFRLTGEADAAQQNPE